jgi:hypothetical protein
LDPLLVIGGVPPLLPIVILLQLLSPQLLQEVFLDPMLVLPVVPPGLPIVFSLKVRVPLDQVAPFHPPTFTLPTVPGLIPPLVLLSPVPRRPLILVLVPFGPVLVLLTHLSY